MSKDDNYMAVLLEDIRDQNRAVLEAVGQIQGRMEVFATKESLDAVATDIKTIKAAVTDTNIDLVDVDRRVTILESR